MFQHHAYDYESDGSANVSFYFAQQSLKNLEKIAASNDLNTYEEAMLWLIRNYEQRPFTWKFNHCNKPKFWFGDCVSMGQENIREGVIQGMQWMDKEEISHYPPQLDLKPGWHYLIRWNNREVKLQYVSENCLKLIP